MNRSTLTVLVLIVCCVFSANTLAGNVTNASDGGNVTGLVVCEDTEDTIAVDELTVAIASSACSCAIENCALDEVGCEEGTECSVCLAGLKRLGLTITAATAFYGFDTEDNESEFLYHNVLEGNAGPFIDRFGGCPCDAECEP